jgi:ABC-2 type transport system ATP-binding protein
METVIQTEQLSKRFGAKHAVDRLDLGVPAGAIFALLGDNGAGKTTTIRMLTGLLPPDSGRATILGQDCWSAAVALRSKVGYVPERPRYYDWMTVAEIGWFAAGFHAEGYAKRYHDWTQKFRLDPKAKLEKLSKGEYAKVGLALALALDPQVLILDEPTSGLDLHVRHEFLGSMVGMAAEGRTILISSHQIAEVERVASHVAFLSHGRLLLTASMEELRERIVRLKLRADTEPPDPGRFGAVLQRNGAGKQLHAVLQDPRREELEALRHAEGICDLEVTAMSLEEIYFALVKQKEVTP